MTNYLGEESDIDEYYQLEQQIYNKPKQIVQDYANLVKSQVSEGGDIFGDLDMGLLDSEYKYGPNQPILQESVIEPQAQSQSSINVSNSIIDVPQPYFSQQQAQQQTAQQQQKSMNAAKKTMIPKIEDEFYDEPSPNNKQFSILKQPQYPQQQQQQKIISPKMGKKENQINIVKLPQSIQKQLQEQPQTSETVKQLLQPGAPINYDEQMEFQLKSLEVEIQKQTKINSDMEETKRRLLLDFGDKKRELDQERVEFSNFKKQELAEMKRQKQLFDDARQQKQIKQSQFKELEAKVLELEKQNQLHAQDKLKQNATHKQILEAVRQKLDQALNENIEIKDKIAEQDRVMLGLKKQESAAKTQNDKLKQENLQLITENKLLQQQIQQLEDRFLDNSYQQANVVKQQNLSTQPIVDITGIRTQKMVQQQQQQYQNPDQIQKTQKKVEPETKQLYSAPANTKQDNERVLYKASAKPKKMGEPAPFGDEINPQFDQMTGEVDWRNQFNDLPYFEPNELCDQFNIDLEYYVLNSEIIHTEIKNEKEEQMFASGAKLVKMSNGTTKLVLPDGCCNIRFQTGDMKRLMTIDGKQQTIYFYHEAGTLFTQLSLKKDGVLKVYRFENGQFEKHFEDGRKVVYYPDGTVKYIYVDGREKAIFTDGSVEVFQK